MRRGLRGAVGFGALVAVVLAFGCQPAEPDATGDAGETHDGGLSEDASPTGDAGRIEDAGGAQDAGEREDASGVEDAGLEADASLGVDGGQPEDAGEPGDAGQHDGGAPAEAGESTSDAGGGTEPTTVAYNGDDVAGGAGWTTPPTGQSVQPEAGVSRAGQALHWSVPVASGNAWYEWGWNWAGWDASKSTPAASAVAFRFWLRIDGNAPAELQITLDSPDADQYAHMAHRDGGDRGVRLTAYVPNFGDGQWHEVTLPLADILVPPDDQPEEFERYWEIFVGGYGSGFDAYLDDLSFVF